MIEIPYRITTKEGFCELLEILRVSKLTISNFDLQSNELICALSRLEKEELIPDYRSNLEFNFFMSNILGFDIDDFGYLTVTQLEMDYGYSPIYLTVRRESLWNILHKRS